MSEDLRLKHGGPARRARRRRRNDLTLGRTRTSPAPARCRSPPSRRPRACTMLVDSVLGQQQWRLLGEVSGQHRDALQRAPARQVELGRRPDRRSRRYASSTACAHAAREGSARATGTTRRRRPGDSAAVRFMNGSKPEHDRSERQPQRGLHHLVLVRRACVKAWWCTSRMRAVWPTRSSIDPEPDEVERGASCEHRALREAEGELRSACAPER